ncbi:MAG: hypothetical protein IAC23_06845 [Bacteroidetes bacterium]|uniref:Ribosomal RNA large subunit methyltransferase K/L-like methyltransferase domain-containing protein n=1 Tax=Candidatus Cryptobacteroides merdavium TaxID=2840769 RepID=A0A9D9HC27_9BACT|nr:hypothetical protein [Candidatus Cryptobacteroides merdavium]
MVTKTGTRHEPGEFRFKRFSVRNERSAMKVNTDGVILGAAMTITGDERHILDIGTGTGTIALMAAQRISDILKGKDTALQTGQDRFNGTDGDEKDCRSGADTGIAGNIGFMITGIDIDKDSAEEAAWNFSRTEWSGHLKAAHLSLDEYAAVLTPETRFCLICSNPPYYTGDLKAPDMRRCNARHSGSMSWQDITDFAEKFLSEDGRLALILPSDQERNLIRHAAMKGLYASRLLHIRTVHRKAPGRTVAEFLRYRTADMAEDMLTIQDGGAYTPEYKSLLSDFLVNF